MVVVGRKDLNVSKEVLQRELLSQNTVKVDCTPTKMCISLSKLWLSRRWSVSDPRDLSLNLPCDQSASFNLTHVTLCTANQQLSTCGTEFAVNDSYVTYSNNITVKHPRNLTSQYKRSFPWRCVYPVRILVGVKYIPDLSPVTQFLGKKTGEGTFQAAMFIYQDDEYTSIYQSPPRLEMDDRIRVRVRLIQGPSFTKMQLYRCWGTPQPLGTTPQQEYELISDYCPAVMSRDANVTIISNGNEQHATWESSVFRFVNSTKLYLHCRVKLCFGSLCTKTCEGNALNRKRRDIGLENAVVSLGPINPTPTAPIVMRPQNYVIDDVFPDDVTARTTINRENESFLLGMPRIGVYVIIAILVFISMVVAIFAALCVVRRIRHSKKVIITSRKNRDVTRAQSIAMSSNFEIPITVR
uniref:ZP domain-containing protein n=1 Tax=Ciona savignyi TaxID=51511 RepID=H2YIP7_CIOSA